MDEDAGDESATPTVGLTQGVSMAYSRPEQSTDTADAESAAADSEPNTDDTSLEDLMKQMKSM